MISFDLTDENPGPLIHHGYSETTSTRHLANSTETFVLPALKL